MSVTRLRQNQLDLYRVGDELEVYKPGDTLSLWSKAGSLLVLPIEALVFPSASARMKTIIWEGLHHRNLLYIGEVVRRTEENLAQSPYSYGNGFSKRSMQVIKETLADIGLCLGLEVPEWDSVAIEVLQAVIPDSYKLSVGSYLNGVTKPSCSIM